MATADVIKKKPAWVKRQISNEESRLLANEVHRSGAATAMEIGCASGFSSAVIYDQLLQNAPSQARLYGFDFSPTLYYDSSRKTGDALWEIHGPNARVKYRTGLTSAAITAVDLDDPSVEKCDFLFIDANHRTPWPALDMLSLARFLEPQAVIAIHDVDMIYHERFRDCNGSRDLYRCWLGEKWRFKSAPNIAFMRRGSDEIVAESIANSLMCDWDEPMKENRVKAYRRMTTAYGDMGRRVKWALDKQSARPVTEALQGA